MFQPRSDAMRQSIVLAGLISFGLASAAVAAGAGGAGYNPAGSGSSIGGGGGSEADNDTTTGRSSATDQSGTHDTGIGTDQKLSIGPGAKSTMPAGKDLPDKMSNPD
jgi:hypothetical protein